MRSELNIIRRDLSEYRKPILILMGAMLALPLIFRQSLDFAKGAVAGLMIGASYGFAQMCFITERQRRTLDLLLSLPIRPFHLVLAKYGSVFSMSLLLVNVPGVFLLSVTSIYIANAAAIFCAAVCTTPSVLSDKPWAPQVPVWIAIGLLPLLPLVRRWWPESILVLRSMASHPLIISTALLAISGVMVLVAALLFERKSIQ